MRLAAMTPLLLRQIFHGAAPARFFEVLMMIKSRRKALYRRRLDGSFSAVRRRDTAVILERRHANISWRAAAATNFSGVYQRL